MPLSCPKCETLLTASRRQQGQLVQCPVCETKLRLPVTEQVESVPSNYHSVEPKIFDGPVGNDPVLDAILAPLPPASIPGGTAASRPPRRRVFKNGFQKKAEVEGASTWLVISMVSLFLIGVIVVVLAVNYKNRKVELGEEQASEILPEQVEPPAGQFLPAEPTEEHRFLPAENSGSSDRKSGSVQIWE